MRGFEVLDPVRLKFYGLASSLANELRDLLHRYKAVGDLLKRVIENRCQKLSLNY